MFTPLLPGTSLNSWNYLQNTKSDQLQQFSRDAILSREQENFKEKIVNFTSVEDLMGDYQALKVALGAHGLQEDLPNRYFVQQVIEQGTEAEGAFANRLSDSRYTALAQTFEDLGLTGTGEIEPGASTASLALQNEIIYRYGESPLYLNAAGKLESDLNLSLLGANTNDRLWELASENDALYGVMTQALGMPSSFASLDATQQINVLKGAADYQYGGDTLGVFSDPSHVYDIADAYLGTAGEDLADAFSFGGMVTAFMTITGDHTDDADRWTALQADTALRDVVATGLGMDLAALDAMNAADQLTALQAATDTAFGRDDFGAFLVQANQTNLGDRNLAPAGTALNQAFTIEGLLAEVTAVRDIEPSVDEYWTAAVALPSVVDGFVEAYGLDPSFASQSTESQIATLKSETKQRFGSEDVRVLQTPDNMATFTGLYMDAQINEITEDYLEQEFRLAVGELRPELRVALSVAEELQQAVDTGGTADGQWYRALSSSVLRETFETAFNLGSSFVSMDLDSQVRTLEDMSESLIGSRDLSAYLENGDTETLIQRYLTFSGTTNGSVSSPALSLFSGGSAASILTTLYS